MKKLVQLALAVAAVGLLVGCAQDARETGRQDACPATTSHSYQYQLAAKSTDQFLNQLAACSIH